MIERALHARSERALFDTQATRTLEQRAAATLPAFTLMTRAGAALARLTRAVAPHARSAWIVAGPGNNGGDGLVAATALKAVGLEVSVTLIGEPTRLPADARTAWQQACDAGVRIVTADEAVDAPDVAIDALLGLGAIRAPEGAMAEAIRRLNALTCPVVAVDLPSGLHADTGASLGVDCVRATHTLAMLTLKPGLFTAAGRDHVGTVWWTSLDIDHESTEPQAWLTSAEMPAPWAARQHAQHKGSFGDVGVVGGGHGMVGAALLASRAAHAAGAGRVFVQPLASEVAMLDPLRPELMFRSDWVASGPAVLAGAVVVCGCGGGDAVRAPLPRLLALAGRLLLDADALNAIASDSGLAGQLVARTRRDHPTVLTPHPLEAARLLGCSTGQVQADRLNAAQTLADRFHAVVVLKGSGSVIAAPAFTPRINGTGNAALATAGTGDVLAGWLGGRWARSGASLGLASAFGVACHAVAEHGAAAEPEAPGALLASDLIARLHALDRRG